MLKFHWFLPTNGGDGRQVVGGGHGVDAGAVGRPASVPYLGPDRPQRRAARLRGRAHPDRRLVRGRVADHRDARAGLGAAEVPRRLPARADLAVPGRPDGRAPSRTSPAAGCCSTSSPAARATSSGCSATSSTRTRATSAATSSSRSCARCGPARPSPSPAGTCRWSTRASSSSPTRSPRSTSAAPRRPPAWSPRSTPTSTSPGASRRPPWPRRSPWIRGLAEQQGREIRFGIRMHTITRDTSEEAWAEADRLLAGIDDETIAQVQAGLRRSESEGQRRMLDLNGGSKDDLEIHPNVWAGVGLVRGGAGTALVGSHERGRRPDRGVRTRSASTSSCSRRTRTSRAPTGSARACCRSWRRGACGSTRTRPPSTPQVPFAAAPAGRLVSAPRPSPGRVVVGNPKPASRTLAAATHVARELAGAEPDLVVDLADARRRRCSTGRDPTVAALVDGGGRGRPGGRGQPDVQGRPTPGCSSCSSTASPHRRAARASPCR